MATSTKLIFLVNFVRLFVFFSVISCSFGRSHTLNVKDDQRKQITCSTFGFLKGGYLSVTLGGFTSTFTPTDTDIDNHMFGFTLDKTYSSGISPYLENKEDTCVLKDPNLTKDESVSMLFFTLDLKNKELKIIRKGDDFQKIEISRLSAEAYATTVRNSRSVSKHGSSSILHMLHKRDTNTLPDVKEAIGPAVKTPQAVGVKPKEKTTSGSKAQEEKTKVKATSGSKTPDGKTKEKATTGNKTPEGKATLKKTPPGTTPATKPGVTGQGGKGKKEEKGPSPVDLMVVNSSVPLHYVKGSINVHFLVAIKKDKEEGLYSLFFHNCGNYESEKLHNSVNFSLNITERNVDSYLSAGEIPLPPLYFALCILFLFTGCFWFYVLRKSKEGIYKIHYLMLGLVFVKSIAFLFHGVNFHFIGQEGFQEEGWAVVYYITHLMKGALLFITIVLIGAGWAFIKHMLSDRDKKIFLIVIPLQILANVAQIIIEESEEGTTRYTTWKEVFILVDLLCCGAILFPVVWSIRHLQEGSQTDGKAAINLRKLKLFRHFYIMVVCYIYFTRIIVYLLKITVPFQFQWLDELFKEAATFCFFVITGYKFRPASDNPYLQVPMEDEEEIEMDEVLKGKMKGKMKGKLKGKPILKGKLKGTQ